MSEADSQGPRDSVQDVLGAWLTAFQCLRTEIQWLIKDGMTYQYFAILLISAAAPTIGWAIEKSPKLLIPALLVFSFVLSWLGFLYFWEHEEIHLVASYLKFRVRPRVCGLIGDEDWWGWEEYKEQSRGRLGVPSLLKNVFLDRCLLFIFPSLASWIAMIVFAVRRWSDCLKWYPGHGLIIILGGLFVLDSLVLAKLLVTIIIKGNMARRYLSHSPADSGPDNE